MSTIPTQEEIPASYQTGVLAVLGVSFLYALFTAQLFLWLMSVAAVISFVLSLVIIYLFYRLVLAIEQIANKM